MHTMEDTKIVALYWQRNEDAITQTDLKYGRYLLSVAGNIVWENRDCEECLNDTYMGAWNAMPPENPHVLRAFLTTIMRRVAINRYHSEHKKRNIPTEMTVALSEVEAVLPAPDTPEAVMEARRLGELISAYLRTQSRRKRFVFMSRYFGVRTVEQIAKDLNLSRATVNKELACLRNGLKAFLEKEGYAL